MESDKGTGFPGPERSSTLADLLKSRVQAFQPAADDSHPATSTAKAAPVCRDCGSPLSEMSEFCWMCGAARDETTTSSVNARSKRVEPEKHSGIEGSGRAEALAETVDSMLPIVDTPAAEDADRLSWMAPPYSDSPAARTPAAAPPAPPQPTPAEPELFANIYRRSKPERHNDEEAEATRRFDYRLVAIPALLVLNIGLIYTQWQNLGAFGRMMYTLTKEHLVQLWQKEQPHASARQTPPSNERNKIRTRGFKRGTGRFVDRAISIEPEHGTGGAAVPKSMRVRVVGQPTPMFVSAPTRTATSDPRSVSVSVADASVRPQPQWPIPVQVSPRESLAMLLKQVAPVYPAAARDAGVHGAVVLKARIGKDGNVSGTEVVSGDPLLTNAAQEAVGQWAYRPYYRNGQPLEVETIIVVEFPLATQRAKTSNGVTTP